jgi:hypothetical protein
MSRTSTTTKQPAAVDTDSKTLEISANASRCRELGICLSCNHRATCLFLASARRPIFFCEEFDDRATDSDQSTPAPAMASTRVEINYGEAQEQGLCANCTSKTDCMNRRHGVAVWHCEDYS